MHRHVRSRTAARVLAASVVGILAGASFASLLLAFGCAAHAPASIQTPAGQTAYTADQVVQQLGHFQQTVIDLSNANKLRTQDAVDLVTWLSGDAHATPPVIGLLDTIAAHPGRWQLAAQQTWTRLRPRLAGYADLQAWLPIVDGLLGS